MYKHCLIYLPYGSDKFKALVPERPSAYWLRCQLLDYRIRIFCLHIHKKNYLYVHREVWISRRMLFASLLANAQFRKWVLRSLIAPLITTIYLFIWIMDTYRTYPDEYSFTLIIQKLEINKKRATYFIKYLIVYVCISCQHKLTKNFGLHYIYLQCIFSVHRFSSPT